MIVTTGLSLEQAPPIDLPMRFFLSAPLFAIAAAVLLMIEPGSILATRWSPATLAATHLVTVGFLGQVMAGALLQMLPVIAGAPVPVVRPLGAAIHGLLLIGAIVLALGFLLAKSLVLAAGALCAALGFGLLAAGALAALILRHRMAGSASGRSHSAMQTVTDLLTALLKPTSSFAWPLFGLLITVGLGLLLSAALLGWFPLAERIAWVDAHARWGLFGWVGLLILTVSVTVVPLFFVTPPYARWFTRSLAPGLFLVLAMAGFRPLLVDFAPMVDLIISLSLAGGYALFALITLALLTHRARPRPDATLLHWWTALGAILIAVLASAMDAPASWLGLWLLVAIGIGLPSGMLLKIVPFLCWFHLQSRQLSLGRLSVRVPHMHRLAPERFARGQAIGQIAAVTLLLMAGLMLSRDRTLASELTRAGAALVMLTQLGFLVLLSTALWQFRQVARALR